MKRILFLILILVGVCNDVHAQKELAIQAAFDEYAIGKNATEVVMGPGRLKKYNLSLFHSLEIKMPSAAALQRIEALVQSDAAQAIVHKEHGGHKLYELPKRKGMHCYIFFRQTNQTLILIYIEGKASLKQIELHFLRKQN
ncbi:MAG: hypothetical protein J6W03_00925 [Bacteroidaceae bacterium]|nr:hypothetical protein [Bacteroidaceae bacterium]